MDVSTVENGKQEGKQLHSNTSSSSSVDDEGNLLSMQNMSTKQAFTSPEDIDNGNVDCSLYPNMQNMNDFGATLSFRSSDMSNANGEQDLNKDIHTSHLDSSRDLGYQTDQFQDEDIVEATSAGVDNINKIAGRHDIAMLTSSTSELGSSIDELTFSASDLSKYSNDEPSPCSDLSGYTHYETSPCSDPSPSSNAPAYTTSAHVSHFNLVYFPHPSRSGRNVSETSNEIVRSTGSNTRTSQRTCQDALNKSLTKRLKFGHEQHDVSPALPEHFRSVTRGYAEVHGSGQSIESKIPQQDFCVYLLRDTRECPKTEIEPELAQIIILQRAAERPAIFATNVAMLAKTQKIRHHVHTELAIKEVPAFAQATLKVADERKTKVAEIKENYRYYEQQGKSQIYSSRESVNSNISLSQTSGITSFVTQSEAKWTSVDGQSETRWTSSVQKNNNDESEHNKRVSFATDRNIDNLQAASDEQTNLKPNQYDNLIYGEALSNKSTLLVNNMTSENNNQLVDVIEINSSLSYETSKADIITSDVKLDNICDDGEDRAMHMKTVKCQREKQNQEIPDNKDVSHPIFNSSNTDVSSPVIFSATTQENTSTLIENSVGVTHTSSVRIIHSRQSRVSEAPAYREESPTVETGSLDKVEGCECTSMESHEITKQHGDMECHEITKQHADMESHEITKQHADMESHEITKQHADMECHEITKQHADMESHEITKQHADMESHEITKQHADMESHEITKQHADMESHEITKQHADMESHEITKQHADMESHEITKQHANMESHEITKQHADMESHEITKQHADMESHEITKQHADMESHEITKQHADMESHEITKQHADMESHEITKQHADMESHEITKQHADMESHEITTQHADMESHEITKQHADMESHEITKQHADMESHKITKQQADIESHKITKQHADMESHKITKQHADMESHKITKQHADMESHKITKQHADMESHEITKQHADMESLTDEESLAAVAIVHYDLHLEFDQQRTTELQTEEIEQKRKFEQRTETQSQPILEKQIEVEPLTEKESRSQDDIYIQTKQEMPRFSVKETQSNGGSDRFNGKLMLSCDRSDSFSVKEAQPTAVSNSFNVKATQSDDNVDRFSLKETDSSDSFSVNVKEYDSTHNENTHQHQASTGADVISGDRLTETAGPSELEHVTNSGPSELENVTDSGPSELENVTDSGPSELENVTDSGPSELENVTDSGPSELENVTDSGPSELENVTNSGPSELENVTDSGPSELENVTDSGPSELENVTDSGPSELENVTDSGPSELENVTKSGPSELENVTDSGPSELENVTDSRPSELKNVTDSGPSELENVTKSGPSELENVTKSGPSELENVTDSGPSELENVTDSRPSELKNVTDSGSSELENVTDSGPSELENVTDSFCSSSMDTDKYAKYEKQAVSADNRSRLLTSSEDIDVDLTVTRDAGLLLRTASPHDEDERINSGLSDTGYHTSESQHSSVEKQEFQQSFLEPDDVELAESIGDDVTASEAALVLCWFGIVKDSENLQNLSLTGVPGEMSSENQNYVLDNSENANNLANEFSHIDFDKVVDVPEWRLACSDETETSEVPSEINELLNRPLTEELDDLGAEHIVDNGNVNMSDEREINEMVTFGDSFQEDNEIKFGMDTMKNSINEAAECVQSCPQVPLEESRDIIFKDGRFTAESSPSVYMKKTYTVSHGVTEKQHGWHSTEAVDNATVLSGRNQMYESTVFHTHKSEALSQNIIFENITSTKDSTDQKDDVGNQGKEENNATDYCLSPYSPEKLEFIPSVDVHMSDINETEGYACSMTTSAISGITSSDEREDTYRKNRAPSCVLEIRNRDSVDTAYSILGTNETQAWDVNKHKTSQSLYTEVAERMEGEERVEKAKIISEVATYLTLEEQTLETVLQHQTPVSNNNGLVLATQQTRLPDDSQFPVKESLVESDTELEETAHKENTGTVIPEVETSQRISQTANTEFETSRKMSLVFGPDAKLELNISDIRVLYDMGLYETYQGHDALSKLHRQVHIQRDIASDVHEFQLASEENGKHASRDEAEEINNLEKDEPKEDRQIHRSHLELEDSEKHESHIQLTDTRTQGPCSKLLENDIHESQLELKDTKLQGYYTEVDENETRGNCTELEEHETRGICTELEEHETPGTCTELEESETHRTYTEPEENETHRTNTEPEESETHRTYTKREENETHRTYIEPEENETRGTYSELVESESHEFYLEIKNRKKHGSYTELQECEPRGAYTELEESEPREAYTELEESEPRRSCTELEKIESRRYCTERDESEINESQIELTYTEQEEREVHEYQREQKEREVHEYQREQQEREIQEYQREQEEREIQEYQREQEEREIQEYQREQEERGIQEYQREKQEREIQEYQREQEERKIQEYQREQEEREIQEYQREQEEMEIQEYQREKQEREIQEYQREQQEREVQEYQREQEERETQEYQREQEEREVQEYQREKQEREIQEYQREKQEREIQEYQREQQEREIQEYQREKQEREIQEYQREKQEREIQEYQREQQEREIQEYQREKQEREIQEYQREKQEREIHEYQREKQEREIQEFQREKDAREIREVQREQEERGVHKSESELENRQAQESHFEQEDTEMAKPHSEQEYSYAQESHFKPEESEIEKYQSELETSKTEELYLHQEDSNKHETQIRVKESMLQKSQNGCVVSETFEFHDIVMHDTHTVRGDGKANNIHGFQLKSEESEIHQYQHEPEKNEIQEYPSYIEKGDIQEYTSEIKGSGIYEYVNEIEESEVQEYQHGPEKREEYQPELDEREKEKDEIQEYLSDTETGEIWEYPSDSEECPSDPEKGERQEYPSDTEKGERQEYPSDTEKGERQEYPSDTSEKDERQEYSSNTEKDERQEFPSDTAEKDEGHEYRSNAEKRETREYPNYTEKDVKQEYTSYAERREIQDNQNHAQKDKKERYPSDTDKGEAEENSRKLEESELENEYQPEPGKSKKFEFNTELRDTVLRGSHGEPENVDTNETHLEPENHVTRESYTELGKHAIHESHVHFIREENVMHESQNWRGERETGECLLQFQESKFQKSQENELVESQPESQECETKVSQYESHTNKTEKSQYETQYSKTWASQPEDKIMILQPKLRENETIAYQHEAQENETPISQHDTEESETQISQHDTEESKTQISQHDTEENETQISQHDTEESETHISQHDTEESETQISQHDTEESKTQISQHDTEENETQISQHETEESETQISQHDTQESETQISQHDTEESETQISQHETQESETQISQHDTEESETQISQHDTEESETHISQHETQKRETQISQHERQESEITISQQETQSKLYITQTSRIESKLEVCETHTSPTELEVLAASSSEVESAETVASEFETEVENTETPEFESEIDNKETRESETEVQVLVTCASESEETPIQEFGTELENDVTLETETEKENTQKSEIKLENTQKSETEIEKTQKSETEIENIETRESDAEKETAETQESDAEIKTAERKESDAEIEFAETQESDGEIETVETHESDGEIETLETQECDAEKEISETQESDAEIDTAEIQESDAEKETVEIHERDAEIETAETQECDSEIETVETQESDGEIETLETQACDAEKETAETQECDAEIGSAEIHESDTEIETAEKQECDAEIGSAEKQECDAERGSAETQESDTEIETAEKQECDAEIGSAETQESDIEIETAGAQESDTEVETQECDAEIDTVETRESDGEIETLETQECDAEIETVETQECDAEIVTVETQECDAEIETVETQECDAEIDTAETQESDTEIKAAGTQECEVQVPLFVARASDAESVETMRRESEFEVENTETREFHIKPEESAIDDADVVVDESNILPGNVPGIYPISDSHPEWEESNQCEYQGELQVNEEEESSIRTEECSIRTTEFSIRTGEFSIRAEESSIRTKETEDWKWKDKFGKYETQDSPMKQYFETQESWSQSRGSNKELSKHFQEQANLELHFQDQPNQKLAESENSPLTGATLVQESGQIEEPGQKQPQQEESTSKQPKTDKEMTAGKLTSLSGDNTGLYSHESRDMFISSQKTVSYKSVSVQEKEMFRMHPKLSEIKKLDSEIFYTVDNSQFEDEYYDAKESLNKTSTKKATSDPDVNILNQNAYVPDCTEGSYSVSEHETGNHQSTVLSVEATCQSIETTSNLKGTSEVTEEDNVAEHKEHDMGNTQETLYTEGYTDRVVEFVYNNRKTINNSETMLHRMQGLVALSEKRQGQVCTRKEQEMFDNPLTFNYSTEVENLTESQNFGKKVSNEKRDTGSINSSIVVKDVLESTAVTRSNEMLTTSTTSSYVTETQVSGFSNVITATVSSYTRDITSLSTNTVPSLAGEAATYVECNTTEVSEYVDFFEDSATDQEIIDQKNINIATSDFRVADIPAVSLDQNLTGQQVMEITTSDFRNNDVPAVSLQQNLTDQQEMDKTGDSINADTSTVSTDNTIESITHLLTTKKTLNDKMNVNADEPDAKIITMKIDRNDEETNDFSSLRKDGDSENAAAHSVHATSLILQASTAGKQAVYNVKDTEHDEGPTTDATLNCKELRNVSSDNNVGIDMDDTTVVKHEKQTVLAAEHNQDVLAETKADTGITEVQSIVNTEITESPTCENTTRVGVSCEEITEKITLDNYAEISTTDTNVGFTDETAIDTNRIKDTFINNIKDTEAQLKTAFVNFDSNKSGAVNEREMHTSTNKKSMTVSWADDLESKSEDSGDTETVEDDNYTTQLAQVHSAMTSFSRRVSCDIDLSQMEVIGAIDSLVEKMTFELQQGTLSSAEVLQEISHLTSNCSKPSAEDSHTITLHGNHNILPESPQQTDAKAVTESNMEPVTLLPKGDESLTNRKRDKLENEISSILDEIMSVLGAVSHQRGMSMQDISLSEISMPDIYSKDAAAGDQVNSVSDELTTGLTSTVLPSQEATTAVHTVTERTTTSEITSLIHTISLSENHISVAIPEEGEETMQVPYNSPKSDDVNDLGNYTQEDHDMLEKRQEVRHVCVKCEDVGSILLEEEDDGVEVELSENITTQHSEDRLQEMNTNIASQHCVSESENRTGEIKLDNITQHSHSESEDRTEEVDLSGSLVIQYSDNKAENIAEVGVSKNVSNQHFVSESENSTQELQKNISTQHTANDTEGSTHEMSNNTITQHAVNNTEDSTQELRKNIMTQHSVNDTENSTHELRKNIITQHSVNYTEDYTQELRNNIIIQHSVSESEDSTQELTKNIITQHCVSELEDSVAVVELSKNVGAQHADSESENSAVEVEIGKNIETEHSDCKSVDIVEDSELGKNDITQHSDSESEDFTHELKKNITEDLTQELKKNIITQDVDSGSENGAEEVEFGRKIISQRADRKLEVNMQECDLRKQFMTQQFESEPEDSRREVKNTFLIQHFHRESENSTEKDELSKNIMTQHFDRESSHKSDITCPNINAPFEDTKLSLGDSNSFESSNFSNSDVFSVSCADPAPLEFGSRFYETSFETSMHEERSSYVNTETMSGDVSIDSDLSEIRCIDENVNRILAGLQSTSTDSVVYVSDQNVSEKHELEDSNVVHVLQIQEKSEGITDRDTNGRNIPGLAVMEITRDITSTELHRSQRQSDILACERLDYELKGNILGNNFALSTTEVQSHVSSAEKLACELKENILGNNVEQTHTEVQFHVSACERQDDEMKENILDNNVVFSYRQAQSDDQQCSEFNVSESIGSECRTFTDRNEAFTDMSLAPTIKRSKFSVVNHEEITSSISVSGMAVITSVNPGSENKTTPRTSEFHISVGTFGDSKTETEDATVQTYQKSVDMSTSQEYMTHVTTTSDVHSKHSVLTSSEDKSPVIFAVDSASPCVRESTNVSLPSSSTTETNITAHTTTTETEAESKAIFRFDFDVTDSANLVTETISSKPETVSLEAVSSGAVQMSPSLINVNKTKDADTMPEFLETSSLILIDNGASETEAKRAEHFALKEMNSENYIQAMSEFTTSTTQSERLNLQEIFSRRSQQSVMSEVSEIVNNQEFQNSSITSEQEVRTNKNEKTPTSSVISSDSEAQNIDNKTSNSDTVCRSSDEHEGQVKSVDISVTSSERLETWDEVSQQTMFSDDVYKVTETKSLGCSVSETLAQSVLTSLEIDVAQEDTHVPTVKSKQQEDTIMSAVKSSIQEDIHVTSVQSSTQEYIHVSSIQSSVQKDTHVSTVKSSVQEDTHVSTVQSSTYEDTPVSNFKSSMQEIPSLQSDLDDKEVAGEIEGDEVTKGNDDTDDDNNTDDDEEEEEQREEDDDESNNNSEFADDDDFGSYFDTPDYQERLRHEVASAISKEIVLMAEVEVALEDLSNPKESSVSPVDGVSSNEAFAAYESKTSTQDFEAYKSQMTVESRQTEKNKTTSGGVMSHSKYAINDTNTDYNLNLNLRETSNTVSNSQSHTESSKQDFEGTYLNTKALSTELQLTVRGDFVNQSNLLLSEKESFTREERPGVIESISSHIVKHNSETATRSSKIANETTLNLGAVSKHQSKEILDKSGDDECLLTEEETDDEFSHEHQHSMSFQQHWQQRLSENVETMTLEEKIKMKRKFSRSKRRRLQRLRRKHALAESSAHELEQKADVQVSIVDTSSSLQTGVEAEEKASDERLPQDIMEEMKKKQTESVDSTRTRTSDILSGKYDYKDKAEGKNSGATNTEQLNAVFMEKHSKSKKGRKNKNKAETIHLSSTGAGYATIPQVVINEPDKPTQSTLDPECERSRRQKAVSPHRLSTGRSQDKAAEGSQNSPATLQVGSHKHGSAQSPGSPDQARSHSSQRPRSSKSRSRSPAPPNLRQITGQPQRRRRRKNIVVVTNPLQF